MNYNLLLDLTADLGYRLASNGAETYRVEDSISRILSAYGINSEVFAIPNCLTVSIETAEGKPMTRMRRILNVSTNMDAIERYNSLSRRICANTPDAETAYAWLKETDQSTTQYNTLFSLIGHIVTAFGFWIFFGGTLLDSLCSAVCGLLIGIISLLTTRLKVNTFFSTILSAFVMASAACLCAGTGLTTNLDAVIIGALMLLVPGMLFTNAMRDIIFGDTNSGMNRIVQVLLIAVAIALGTGCAQTLCSGIVHIPESIPLTHPGWLQCIAAAVACVGFAIVFNVHGRGFVLCVLGGSIAWAAYLIAYKLGCSEPLSYFFAGLIAALYSEIMARIRKYPATSYLVISLMPLFPGAGVYYATNFFINNDMSACAQKGSATIAIAGAIAVGILTVSTLFRLYSNYQQARIKR